MPPVIWFCHYKREKTTTGIFIVLTFSTSSGSMQMSCNERFNGIALMFREVEPVGITRTFMSYFILCSSQDACRVISRKQSKFSFPKLNTVGAGGCGGSQEERERNARNTLAFELPWQPEAWVSTTRETQFKCRAVTASLCSQHQPSPSYGLSCWAEPQPEPQAGITVTLCSLQHSQLTLLFCSFTIAGRKRNLTAVWACREMHKP